LTGRTCEDRQDGDDRETPAPHAAKFYRRGPGLESADPIRTTGYGKVEKALLTAGASLASGRRREGRASDRDREELPGDDDA
jgi:hypothetical protein